jgi:hypothetical protein
MALSLAACAGASQTKSAGSDAKASGSASKEGSGEKAGGWMTLFNGENLDGWVATGGNKDAFYVKDGLIECNGGGGGWLRYNERQFEDFIFSLDYKISEGGNSGISIRSTVEGNPAFTGMEVQILDDHGKPPTMHSAGSIYGSITPMRNMSKAAGEWNHVEITCKGENVVVFMNGVKIIDIMMDQHDSLKDRVRKGYVAVQDHGNYVWFRNLKIKPL